MTEKGVNDRVKRKSLTLTVSTNISRWDLTQLIDRAIEPFGRYQKFVIIMMGINSSIVAMSHTLTTFHIYTPENFTCVDAAVEQVDNFTCAAGCKDYHFQGTETSIVTEWSLICDRRFLSALVNTIYFVGVTVGSLVCGTLADRWGRRKLILCCLYLQVIFGASLYLPKHLAVFMILRFMQGFFIQGLQGCSYTLMQEMTPTRHLTLTGQLWEIFWASGMIYLGIVSYFVPDWRTLQLYLVIPTLITLIWCWIVPESPKWYLASNQKPAAFKEALKIAEKNKDQTVFREYSTLQLKPAHVDLEEVTPSIIEPHQPTTFVDLFRNKILQKHAIVMIIVWFSITLSYYGILLYMPKLPGGRHLNFIIGAFIEIIAYILAFFILSSRLGRRHSMIMFQYVNAIFCITLGGLTFVIDNESWKPSVIIAITLLGKGMAVAGFGGMFIFGAELFPTATRASAVGLCGFAARIGSLLAPQIILLGEMSHPMVPMVIMASFLLLGGTSVYFVPETLHKKLPNTLNDVEDAWGKNKP